MSASRTPFERDTDDAARLGLVDAVVVHLDGADLHLAEGTVLHRPQKEFVAGLDLAGLDGARRHRADALDVVRPVDVHPELAVFPGGLRERLEHRVQVAKALLGDGARLQHGDDRLGDLLDGRLDAVALDAERGLVHLAQRALDLPFDLFDPFVVDEVDLRERDDGREVRRQEDAEVLAGRRSHPVVDGDGQQAVVEFLADQAADGRSEPRFVTDGVDERHQPV